LLVAWSKAIIFIASRAIHENKARGIPQFVTEITIAFTAFLIKINIAPK